MAFRWAAREALKVIVAYAAAAQEQNPASPHRPHRVWWESSVSSLETYRPKKLLVESLRLKRYETFIDMKDHDRYQMSTTIVVFLLEKWRI